MRNGATDGAVDSQGLVFLKVLVTLVTWAWSIDAVKEVGIRDGYIVGSNADNGT